MNKEKHIIELITSIMPKSRHRLSKCFESDSEIIEFDNNTLLFTTDGFSAEDMLCDHDPYILGWNVAIGGISDILACGGTPLFYAHSLVAQKSWDEAFITKFSKGISDVLKRSDITFIGGDFGRSNEWSYTASVIGKAPTRTLTRKGAAFGDIIYISGKIGQGNLEAALKLHESNKKLKKISWIFKSKFHLCLKESALIREYATSCIDTSDGVFSSLNTISEINQTGYNILKIPYIKQGILLTKLIFLPRTLLFLAEGGEYELLFTIKEEDEHNFLKEARERRLLFYRLGKIGHLSEKILTEDNKEYDLSNLNIRARDYDKVFDYLKDLIDFLKSS